MDLQCPQRKVSTVKAENKKTNSTKWYSKFMMQEALLFSQEMLAYSEN